MERSDSPRTDSAIHPLSSSTLGSDPLWHRSVLVALLDAGDSMVRIPLDAGNHGEVPLVPVGRVPVLGWPVVGVPVSSSLDLFDLALTGGARNSRSVDRLLEESQLSHPWACLFLPRVPQRSVTVDCVASLRHRVAFSDAGSLAFCNVSSADSLSGLSKDHLRNVDRLRRRAERDYGGVEIASFSDASVSTSVFERFLAVEDAGWKGAQGAGTSLASDTRAQTFFRDVVGRFQEVGRARIDFLTIAGRDAAAQLMVRSGSTWFLLKIGYHPDFKDIGPGSILLKAFLEEMIVDPDIFEVNLTTNPPWAARWHFQTEPVFHVYIYSNTLRGRLLYAGRTVKEVAKLARDRWQSWQSRRRAPPKT